MSYEEGFDCIIEQDWKDDWEPPYILMFPKVEKDNSQHNLYLNTKIKTKTINNNTEERKKMFKGKCEPLYMQSPQAVALLTKRLEEIKRQELEKEEVEELRNRIKEMRKIKRKRDNKH